jgi:hypothetical protein
VDRLVEMGRRRSAERDRHTQGLESGSIENPGRISDLGRVIERP